MSKIPIRFYKDHKVHAIWDEDLNSWWFSVLDIDGAINQQDDHEKNRNYRKYLKAKLRKEQSEVVSDTTQQKLTAADGKKYNTEVIIQAGVEKLARAIRNQQKQFPIVGIVFVAIALLACGCTSSRSSAEHAAETKKAVTEALANKQLRINVRSMNPVRFAFRTVSYGFYLEIKGDKLVSCLPYMGQVYQTSTFSPQNLNFEAPIISYHETRPKKGLTRIELAVRTTEDIYHYQLDIYDSGTAYIRVHGQSRDSISFDGDCDV